MLFILTGDIVMDLFCLCNQQCTLSCASCFVLRGAYQARPRRRGDGPIPSSLSVLLICLAPRYFRSRTDPPERRPITPGHGLDILLDLSFPSSSSTPPSTPPISTQAQNAHSIHTSAHACHTSAHATCTSKQAIYTGAHACRTCVHSF